MSEETSTIPKPMLMVGDKPLLQHIIDIYRAQGVWEFIIPVGYKKEQVYAHFLTQTSHYHSIFDDGVEFQMGSYVVKVMDTGLETLTGGRLLRIHSLLKGYKNFHFTYGDGVGNVDLQKLQAQHTGDTLVTMTVVHPVGRFGRAHVNKENKIFMFGEKVESPADWINGGFSILSTKLFLGIAGDRCNLEKDVYPPVARHGFMNANKHEGFWQCVDTLRDLEELRKIYEQETPWLKLSSPGAQGS